MFFLQRTLSNRYSSLPRNHHLTSLIQGRPESDPMKLLLLVTLMFFLIFLQLSLLPSGHLCEVLLITPDVLWFFGVPIQFFNVPIIFLLLFLLFELLILLKLSLLLLNQHINSEMDRLMTQFLRDLLRLIINRWFFLQLSDSKIDIKVLDFLRLLFFFQDLSFFTVLDLLETYDYTFTLAWVFV